MRLVYIDVFNDALPVVLGPLSGIGRVVGSLRSENPGTVRLVLHHPAWPEGPSGRGLVAVRHDMQGTAAKIELELPSESEEAKFAKLRGLPGFGQG